MSKISPRNQTRLKKETRTTELKLPKSGNSVLVGCTGPERPTEKLVPGGRDEGKERRNRPDAEESHGKRPTSSKLRKARRPIRIQRTHVPEGKALRQRKNLQTETPATHLMLEFPGTSFLLKSGERDRKKSLGKD